MEFSKIKELLSTNFSDKFSFNEDVDIIFVHPSNWLEIATFLKNDKALDFNFLMCISGYDKGDGKTYGVAYNFYSISHSHYLEVRIEVEDGVKVPSISSLWSAADWHEREAYDMIGVVFENHPNLKRMLLDDDWEGHPFRKEYKEPDYYHGVPVPKDKSYWE